MGLDDLIVDDDGSDSSDDSKNSEDDGGSYDQDPEKVRKGIENNIKEKVLNNFDSIELEGETVKGDIKDFAMMFAIIGMDYSEVELDDLAGEE